MNNLDNFPHVYYINLDSRVDRKTRIEKKFEEYKISYTRISASNYLGDEQEKWEHLVLDKEVKCSASDIGCTLSHLEALETWIATSNTEVAVIMEDDCDITISDYWKFDWDTLVNNLPFNWDCIQLCMDHHTMIPFYIHPIMRDSGSASCYLINRNYAEKVLRLHKLSDGYRLVNRIGDYGYKEISSHIDYLIFETGKTYSFPVFTIDTSFESDQRNSKLHPRHQPCRDSVVNFWKNKSSTFDLDDFFYYNKTNDHLMVDKLEINRQKYNYT